MEIEADRRLYLNATTDALTGLGNRRMFEKVVQREFARAIRSNQDLTLCMVDIDFLKKSMTPTVTNLAMRCCKPSDNYCAKNCAYKTPLIDTAAKNSQ